MVDTPRMYRDGHVLPDGTPLEIFSDPQRHNMVPVILGTNRDEPALFMARAPEYVRNFLGFLPRLKDPVSYKQRVKYGAMQWKVFGVDSIAEAMTAAGNPNVFAYRFDWDEEPSQFGFDLSTALGAAHGLEIAFAFGDFEGGLGLDYIYPDDEAQMALADSMTSYWTQFAYTGDPGQGRDAEQPHWLSWGSEGKHTIILDSPADQGIFMDAGVLTLDKVKQELAADSFEDPEVQCEIYARNFRDELFDETQYLGLNPVCATINPAELSWF